VALQSLPPFQLSPSDFHVTTRGKGGASVAALVTPGGLALQSSFVKPASVALPKGLEIGNKVRQGVLLKYFLKGLFNIKILYVLKLLNPKS